MLHHQQEQSHLEYHFLSFQKALKKKYIHLFSALLSRIDFFLYHQQDLKYNNIAYYLKLLHQLSLQESHKHQGYVYQNLQ